ncbi:hypothetical protein ACCS33_10675 [Rhizobium ruizarguesonis]|nr:hypothetical protein [Rhizobium leguminosarum bv. viciae]
MSDDRELKDQRIPIMMTASEVTAIDDWSFKNRIRSRGEAIRRLCQIGLVFDNHRKEYVEKFGAIADKVSEITEVVKRSAPADDKSLTGLERELIANGLEMLMAVLPMVALIRTTTGLANNFKSEGNLEEIISEAKAILSLDRDEAANRK